MSSLIDISSSALLDRLPQLVRTERATSADVIEHLAELDRRKLYLEEACSSLYKYCTDRLGYSEDEALKRVRVARLAQKFPAALEELRTGSTHLTALFLLSPHLDEHNASELLLEARGKSRRDLERALATRFPRAEVETRLELVTKPNTCPGTGATRPFEKPLSESHYLVQFTASASLYEKLEQARELLSHSVPSGDLNTVLERALDALIAAETKRRIGTNKPRKRRLSETGSRHVPREVAGIVWKRDQHQCTFVDTRGRRCSERRFLTLEHRQPHALGGPSTVENVCLLCAAHNAQAARVVYGDAFIERKKRQRSTGKARTTVPPASPPADPTAAKLSSSLTAVRAALHRLGFHGPSVSLALERVARETSATDSEALLRAALTQLIVKDGGAAVTWLRPPRTLPDQAGLVWEPLSRGTGYAADSLFATPLRRAASHNDDNHSRSII